MEDSTSFDLIVLGAGPGGIEAAVMAAQNDLKVALVSNQKPGGRAVWGSLVPSKVWLTTAESADILKNSAFHALGAFRPKLVLENLRARVVAQSESASIRYREQLRTAGVTLINGKGQLLNPYSVQVQAENDKPYSLKAEYIVVASGSKPRFSPGIKPILPRIFAPRHTAALSELPKSLLVVGGGVTSVEYAYAFAALGTKVTLLHEDAHLLPGQDTPTVNLLEQLLQQQFKIRIQKNNAVQSLQLEEGGVRANTACGQRFKADYAFLGTGRQADTSFYTPEKLKFELSDNHSLAINAYCQTNYSNIYAVGDVTGAPMTANKASLQARIAIAHLSKTPTPLVASQPVIEMVYTHPEVGKIGDMQADKNALFFEKQYSSLLKAHLEGNTKGMVRIKVADKTGVILGAAVIGQKAAEILSIIQVAMQQGTSYHKLRMAPFAHPSFAELLTTI